MEYVAGQPTHQLDLNGEKDIISRIASINPILGEI